MRRIHDGYDEQVSGPPRLSQQRETYPGAYMIIHVPSAEHIDGLCLSSDRKAKAPHPFRTVVESSFQGTPELPELSFSFSLSLQLLPVHKRN